MSSQLISGGQEGRQTAMCQMELNQVSKRDLKTVKKMSRM